MEATIDNEPLFACAHDALRFAFNFRNDRLGKNALAAWIVDKTRRAASGKGLVGNDGAAQAGMVLAEVDKLGEAMKAAVICRYAERRASCSACGGDTVAQHWREARDELTDYVLPSISGISPRHMRRALVERHFGVPVKMGELAAKHQVHPIPRPSITSDSRAACAALEERAMIALEDALQRTGMVSPA